VLKIGHASRPTLVPVLLRGEPDGFSQSVNGLARQSLAQARLSVSEGVPVREEFHPAILAAARRRIECRLRELVSGLAAKAQPEALVNAVPNPLQIFVLPV